MGVYGVHRWKTPTRTGEWDLLHWISCSSSCARKPQLLISLIGTARTETLSKEYRAGGQHPEGHGLLDLREDAL